MLNGAGDAGGADSTADVGGVGAPKPEPAVPAFSIEQTEKIPPKNSFEKLQRMADEVMAKRDKHSIGGIYRALETEIQRKNNS
jgi:hypothetical protein